LKYPPRFQKKGGPGFTYQHRSALRNTSRLGFAGVPNALNSEPNLLGLFEVAFDLASWR
jgi:hypothetical protein